MEEGWEKGGGEGDGADDGDGIVHRPTLVAAAAPADR